MPAREDVLQRVVQRVAQVQRGRHVGRGDDDRSTARPGSVGSAWKALSSFHSLMRSASRSVVGSYAFGSSVHWMHHEFRLTLSVSDISSEIGMLRERGRGEQCRAATLSYDDRNASIGVVCLSEVDVDFTVMPSATRQASVRATF